MRVTLVLSGEETQRAQSYAPTVRELVRTLEDDERAAQAFLALGLFGIVTWFASVALADTLLPLTTLGAILAVGFGLAGWRAARQGLPREASTFVGLVLTALLAFLWIYLVPVALVRLLP
jgi:hypothetical protein